MITKEFNKYEKALIVIDDNNQYLLHQKQCIQIAKQILKINK